jgi:serine phosphatase RsbU (regulator of sigma subunit)
VQGKGLAAVRTAAVVLGAFREAAFDEADLAAIAARIEVSLKYQTAAEEFVTVVIGQAVVDEGSVTILNCGHPPPLLVRAGSVATIDDPDPGLPLGLAALAPSTRTTVTVPFSPGDQLLCYTDGVSEARDRSGTFYPLARTAELLVSDNQEIALERLQSDVIRYVGRSLDDDAALMLIRPERSAVPGDVPSARDLSLSRVRDGKAGD